MTTAVLFILLFVFLFLGMPIAIALGLSSLAVILLFQPDSIASLVLKFFQTMEQSTLLAIPFFILAGNFLSKDFSILKVNGTKVTDTGKRFQVPGHPASARMGH